MHGVVAGQGVAGGKRQVIEFLVHFQDGVDRALFRSGHVAGDINDAAQVLVIDAGLDGLVLDDDQLAERDHGAVCAGQVDVLQDLLGGAIRAVKLDDGGDRLARGLIVDEATSRQRARAPGHGSHRRPRCRAAPP